MSWFIKSSIIIGSIYLTNKFLNLHFSSDYNKYKLKCFFIGIRCYSKYQIIYNKCLLLCYPYYKKIKALFYKKKQPSLPDSSLTFYKDNQILSSFAISGNLLPQEPTNDDDTIYNVELLREFIANVKETSYDFYVIENKNKKVSDFIIRTSDNETDLISLNNSGNEFLLINLNYSEKSIALELTNEIRNFNILGNIIDKYFVFFYLSQKDITMTNPEYSFFIVDRNAETIVLSNKDSIKLDKNKYTLLINNPILKKTDNKLKDEILDEVKDEISNEVKDEISGKVKDEIKDKVKDENYEMVNLKLE